MIRFTNNVVLLAQESVAKWKVTLLLSKNICKYNCTSEQNNQRLSFQKNIETHSLACIIPDPKIVTFKFLPNQKFE